MADLGTPVAYNGEGAEEFCRRDGPYKNAGLGEFLGRKDIRLTTTLGEGAGGDHEFF